MHPRSRPPLPVDRRTFLIRGSRRGAGLVVASVGLPTLLAACAADDPVISERTTPPPSATPVVTPSEAAEQARAIVGDVIEFELTSDEWPGDFGFVTMQLHAGVVDDSDVYFIRTDASDEDYAVQEQLVWVPRIGLMARDDLAGTAVLFDNPADGQPTVLSSEPGRDDYTPAWLLTRARWSGEPQLLRSLDEVQEAAGAGALELTETDIVLNAAVVKWSSGELPADATERTAYLGPGQLLEPPDTTAMRVTFKLNQCFPGSRYIVTDHSIEMAATMTSTTQAAGRPDRGWRHRSHQRVRQRHPGPRADGVPALCVRPRRRRVRVEPVLGPFHLRVGRWWHPAAAHLRNRDPRRP